MITADNITDEQIRELQRLDLCRVCECGLLAPQHHNDLMDGHHSHESIGREFFDLALQGSNGEEIDVPKDARARCAEILNARTAKAVR